MRIPHADRVGSRTDSGYVTRWKCWKTTRMREGVVRVTSFEWREADEGSVFIFGAFRELSREQLDTRFFRAFLIFLWRGEFKDYPLTWVPGSVRSGCSSFKFLSDGNSRNLVRHSTHQQCKVMQDEFTALPALLMAESCEIIRCLYRIAGVHTGVSEVLCPFPPSREGRKICDGIARK